MNQGFEHDESGVRPIIDQDTIDSVEYARSRDGVIKFLALDPEEIKTYEDLSAKESLLGHDLRTIILAKGKQVPSITLSNQDNDHPTPHTYALEKQVGECTLSAKTEKNRVLISSNKKDEDGNDEPQYLINLPADRDMILARNSLEEMWNFGAIDHRGLSRGVVAYMPNMFPDDPNNLQGFTRIVQEAIRELMSEIPEPTQIPSAFNF